MAATSASMVSGGALQLRDTKCRRPDGRLMISTEIVLDSLKVNRNAQMVVVPAVEHPDYGRELLPAILINGRDMQIAYDRRIVGRDMRQKYDIKTIVERHNGKVQSLDYETSIPWQSWMQRAQSRLVLLVDTCLCGTPGPGGMMPGCPLDLNPFKEMHVSYITPAVTEQPVSVHEGRARVQFEVDRTVLHAEPYTCRNGQRIDNRAELKTIDDTVSYALSNPDVEIAEISVTGLASPESPYVHNADLATGRSRALAEYLGHKYCLTAEGVSYDAVPENWAEFRALVEKATDITNTQRADLMALIDRPAYGPTDYDAKERELKTSPKFKSLYRSKILPEWFPKLRATRFAIKTRLKPADDRRLAEIIKTNPELMTLNQMFRVARLYPEGSPEFNRTILTALKYYPDDETANLNASVQAIKNGDYESARKYLDKAGNGPEAENARGVVAMNRGEEEEAIRHFHNAGNLPEALRNLNLIEP